MLDKKRKVMSPKNNEGLEQDLLSRLIDCSHEPLSLHSYCLAVLDILATHPQLNRQVMVFWHHDRAQIHILAEYLPTLPFPSVLHIKDHLQAHIKLNAEPRLHINVIRLDDKMTELSARMDVHFEPNQQNVYGLSLWSDSAEQSSRLQVAFFKNIFGIINLSLAKIAARSQAHLLNTILLKAGDAVEITDEEAIVQYVNPAFEKITGYTAQEVIGQLILTLFLSPQDDAPLFARIKAQLNAGQTWRGQIQSRKKDGSYWIAQTTIVPVIDNTGQVIQHVAIKQDVSEHVEQINQLRVSEERYRNIMNAAADSVFIHDLDGRILEVNNAACKSLGYCAEELTSSYVWDVEVGASPATLSKLWGDLQRGYVNLEGRHRRKDGSSFPVDVRLSIFNATGKKLVLAIIRDISTQKKAADMIRKLTRALEQSPVLVLITDREGTIEYANAKVLEQTGYQADEILGKNTRILRSGETTNEIYQLMWYQLLVGSEWRGELLNRNKAGETFWVSAIISPLRNETEEITHYLAVMEDISQKKSYEEMLKHQATYDNLTNLPNRFYGFNKLEYAIARAQANKTKLAVLFLDLDEFKQVNDSLGHAAGDLLLKALSVRYLSIIRQSDVIARLGGDEFMVILDNLSHEQDAERIAQKYLEASLQPLNIDAEKVYISSSIGIALFPEHGTDAKILMRNADTAMYQSKLRGKNNATVFISTMAEVASHRIRIKSELHRILDKDELYLCYQPIINVKTNKMSAAEALLRWDSPTLGHVTPEQIIPIAEETGFIVPLGYWVIRTVCNQIKEWQKHCTKKINIAVNISTLQLKQKDFVAQVRRILQETALKADCLTFEITESVFIDDSKFILTQLTQLNQMNIHCSLDDFGMGYSSLSYLRSYPFKSLKIDRAFIQGINTSSSDLSLVNSIITMSRNLKLSVIAEGIESVEQLELMRSMNCELVQGWYFSKALRCDEFFNYLNKD